ncbi:MAG: PecA family PE domain-processing aspartic protease [Actinomycetota bacterium]|nr:PecA family PE domain-processing aspartic protease [Actinomycetota bacterium]
MHYRIVQQGPRTASTRSDATGPRKKATRPSRGPAVSAANAGGSATPALGRKSRVPATQATPAIADIPDVAPAAAVHPEATTEPAESNTPLPAAAVATVATDPAPAVTPKRATRTARTATAPVPTQAAVDPAPVVEDSPAETAPAAAVPGPAADPAPEMTSWLPATPIVPGSKVALALQEIADAQGIITAQTWGSGNVFAGVVAIVPQVFLASAALSLQAWGATNPAAQGFLAATAGIPLIQQAAQVTLLSTMLLPTFAEASMAGAALFLPLVNLFGADVSAAQAEVAAARQDGKVYAVVPVRMVASTQPVVGVSVNGGSNATLLVDSGASGLVTTRDKVGAGDLGAPIGAGSSCFSGGLCYDYTTYNTTVDLGGGASTTAPVNIVDAEDEQLFKDFFSWGADGILGTGANTAGPGPVAIPTALMPGELSNGVLLFQNLFFGLGGVMVLGPNPLPTRVSVPGAPDAFVQVSVNDGPKTDAGAIIDSGGVYGTLNTANDTTGTPVGSNLPAGTKISVYTADGSTLLYTYTTQSGVRGTPVIETGLFNTGNAPFAQGPIYLNYGFDEPYGIGSTDFSIW